MSIQSALNSALSGLTAMTRSANVASNNIANALTEGYGRREIELDARHVGSYGAGVQVTGVNRIVDQLVVADRRVAEADLAEGETKSRFLTDLADKIGEPGASGSLDDRMAQMEATLIDAAARPESQSRLMAAADAMAGVTSHVNEIGDMIQQSRSRADAAIARDVEYVNQSLQAIERLNGDIRRANFSRQDAGALLDERQALVDGIAEILPVRELDREGGRIALVTRGGAVLIDGKAKTLEFGNTPLVTEHHTLGAGLLSEVTLEGRVVDVNGGRLAGNLAVRDDLAVKAQTELDAFARDLVERFQDPAVDPTIAATDPALFTDGGARFDPANEVGLSRRLSLNALADPAQGGEAWRLRDGLGALAQGDVGQSAGLTRLSDALSAGRVPASGSFITGERSATGLAADVLSSVGADLRITDTHVAQASARFDALRLRELENGVDSDAEMQRLLLIEQAYAANARVIETVEEMLDTLMRI